MNYLLSRMIKVARGHANVADVLFSCGEFTKAEILEYLPEVIGATSTRPVVDPIRQGVLS